MDDKHLMHAPVALFVYNRPEHTKATLEALSKNKQVENTILYIFCDGPKSDDDRENVEEVRNIVSKISGFKKIEYF